MGAGGDIEPTESATDPEPTENAADPKPTDYAADPKHTDYAADPEPNAADPLCIFWELATYNPLIT